MWTGLTPFFIWLFVSFSVFVYVLLKNQITTHTCGNMLATAVNFVFLFLV